MHAIKLLAKRSTKPECGKATHKDNGDKNYKITTRFTFLPPTKKKTKGKKKEQD